MSEPDSSSALPNVARGASSDIKHRKSISLLSAGELQALRNALTTAFGFGDRRGYRYHASIHGLPDEGYCEHRNDRFLPWHRAYLYEFEQALQDIDESVTLPWWDWTENAIPEAYQLDMVDGAENPLRRAPIDIPEEQRTDTWAQQTERNPGQPTSLETGGLPSKGEIDAALMASNYGDFRLALENLHNAVHVWAGGHMVDARYAAFDPLFWAHHSMTDRLWWIWQIGHPGAHPPRRILGEGLRFFEGLTVEDTLDVNDLGYDYAMAEILVPFEGI